MVELQLNRGCRRNVESVGAEETPVIILDDPIVSTNGLVEIAAASAGFSPDGEFAYPGIRTNLPDEYARVLGPDLLALIADVYGVPRSARPHLVHQLYSLVTARPAALEPRQRMPHTDNRSSYYFATVHYLTPGDHAGTGFFRHRPTGFERITEDRYPAYTEAVNQFIEANGPPAQKYIDGSDDHYELIGKVDHRQNRLIIYPGNLLHSGLIKPDRDIDDSPASGRLTANLFLYFTPA